MTEIAPNDAERSKKAQDDRIRILCSMAPRLLLEELTQRFFRATGIKIELNAMGGVDAARKVEEPNSYDIAVLSKDAIEQLIASQRLRPASIDLVLSEVAVAVASGQPHPDLSSEDSMKAALLSAKSISYSTGPSGRALAALFEKWGISDTMNERLICPPPGIAVASVVQSGQAEIGFQQRSELIHADGIDVVGPLPDEIQIVTTFTAGICLDIDNLSRVKQLLAFIRSPEATDAKYRQGMRPV